MSSVIVISDDEQDELNVTRHPNLSSPVPPERFLGSKPLTGKVKVNLKIGPPTRRKRGRISDSDVEFVEVGGAPKAKIMRREEHKAVSVLCSCVIYRVMAVACAYRISPSALGPKSSSQL